jgi:RNA polymerase sigma factor (sigma-70 family)
MAVHIANRYGAKTEKCPIWDSERFAVAMLGLSKALRRYRHRRTAKPSTTSTYIYHGIMNELSTFKTIASAKKRIIETEVLSLSNMGLMEKGDYPVYDHREGHESRVESDEYAEKMLARMEKVVPGWWWEVLKEQVCEGLSYRQVAKRHGIGRSRVQQIVENVKHRVRKHFPELCR